MTMSSYKSYAWWSQSSYDCSSMNHACIVQMFQRRFRSSLTMSDPGSAYFIHPVLPFDYGAPAVRGSGWANLLNSISYDKQTQWNASECSMWLVVFRLIWLVLVMFSMLMTR